VAYVNNTRSDEKEPQRCIPSRKVQKQKGYLWGGGGGTNKRWIGLNRGTNRKWEKTSLGKKVTKRNGGD